MTRKPTYGELEKEVKELKEESADRKQMERALQKSSEKIKFFAYSISHDLKSPAIGLYGLTKRLHKDYAEILDEKGQRYCEQILKTAEQIAALVEQITVMSFKENLKAKIKLDRLLQKLVSLSSTAIALKLLPSLHSMMFTLLRLDSDLV